jgi:hypothetical protein
VAQLVNSRVGRDAAGTGESPRQVSTKGSEQLLSGPGLTGCVTVT